MFPVKRPKKSCNFLCQSKHWVCVIILCQKDVELNLSNFWSNKSGQGITCQEAKKELFFVPIQTMSLSNCSHKRKGLFMITKRIGTFHMIDKALWAKRWQKCLISCHKWSLKKESAFDCQNKWVILSNYYPSVKQDITFVELFPYKKKWPTGTSLADWYIFFHKIKGNIFLGICGCWLLQIWGRKAQEPSPCKPNH